MARLAAVTGASGFLGRYIVSALVIAGWRVRILARRSPDHPQLADLQFEAIRGDLSDRRALRDLVDGAEAVIHAAGLIKAPTAAAFRAVNVSGTANLATAVKDSKAAVRVLIVSSMAAREPLLSAYAETKRAGEGAVAGILGPRTEWVIVRPCVVYGPWDRETLAFFRAIGRRVFLCPRVENARIALIHARDAAAAILDLCDSGPSGVTFELTDERKDGYSWGEVVSAAAKVMEVKVLSIPLPGIAVQAAAVITTLAAWLSRRTPTLTPGKAREILHADWGSAAERQPPADLWRPRIGLHQGFRETVCWYRDRLWLPPAACAPAVGDVLR